MVLDCKSYKERRLVPEMELPEGRRFEKIFESLGCLRRNVLIFKDIQMKSELTREDIKYIVKRVLRNYQVQGRDSAARAVATEIYDAIERTYNMNAEWNVANNFPPALEPLVKRMEKGLGILLKRTEPAAKIYEWIAEQEKQGRKVEKFIVWATQPDRAQYLPKYFSKPEYLQVDYQQAFLQPLGDRPEYQPFKTDEDTGQYVPAPRD